ncbi:MAG: cytochrome C [Desulfuromonas sp.]|uniref:cytochrome C n=1 Tax=Desulfuromonas sp. TaxID=892 RepID=UPI000CBED7F7|nr:cytochrome C [Desulfuromonas sp.]PLX84147.1 MAG: cytochrome C [Desulfuromonas sp.]
MRGLFLGTTALLAILSLASGAWGQTPEARPETVCIQCHGGLQGRLGEPVALWEGSVHAANGISCHGCHGGDPTDYAMAMSPERGFVGVPTEEEIPSFCGKCHVGVQEDYLQSAHGQALGGGGPHCVSCHGNHDVREATHDLINSEDCSRCHSYGRAEEIKEAVAETDGMIRGLDSSLASLHRLGIGTKEMAGRLFSLRNRFHRLFHTVDVDKVRSETSAFQAELGQIGEEVDAVESQLSKRKLWGAIGVVLLVLAGFLFLLLRKTYAEEEGLE